MRVTLILLFVALWAFGSGCNVINPKEQIPTYVHVDSFKFSPADYLQYGSNSHAITSVWAYFNNQAIGVFDLPANIPVLANAPGVLSLDPGVTYEGLRDYEIAYPYYQFDTLSIKPSPGNVISFTPTTTYFPNTKLQWKDDFEEGNLFTTTDGSPNILISNDPLNIFEGGGSGNLHMQAPDTITECITTLPFLIPQGESFLEFNYKGDMSFQVGLLGEYPDGSTIGPYYLIGVKPIKDWKKFYLGLQSFTQQYSTVVSFYLVIRGTLDNGTPTGNVYLDNMKVVTF